MRRQIALVLIAIGVLAPLAHAGAEFPSCSLSQLSVVLELAPAYDLLEKQKRRVKSPLGLLDYTKAQLSQRETTWKTLPRCAEAIEYGELMSRRYGLYSAYMTFEFLLTHQYRRGRWTTDNPYSGMFSDESYKRRHRELMTKIEATLSGGSASSQFDAALPLCAKAELNTLYVAVQEFELLSDALAASRNMPEVYEVNSAIAQWNDRTRSRLPACVLAFETGLLMRQYLLDRVLLLDLVIADITTEDHPYWETTQQIHDALYEGINKKNSDIRAHDSWWRFTGMLSACSASQVDSLSAILRGYQDLLAFFADGAPGAELVAFGQAQNEWRRSSWQSLPPCAEALEIALIIYQSAGDSFELVGSDASLLPDSVFASLEGALTAGIRLDERLEQIAATYEGEVDYPQTFSALDNLPTCSVAEAGEVAGSIGDFQAVLAIAAARNEWTGGYLRYVDALLAWRMENASNTPHCRLRLDLSNALAAGVAGFIAENLPGFSQLLNQPGGASPEATPVANEGESNAAARGISGNNLRACSVQELQRLNDKLDAYLSVIDDAQAPGKIADLLDQVIHLLDWRGETWVDLLTCAENFEIGLLINQIASDRLAAYALEFAGFSPIVNPLFKRRQSDLNKLSEWIQLIQMTISEGENLAPRPAEPVILPNCSDDELGAVLDLLNEFRKGPRLLTIAFTPESVRDYSQFQASWRETIWAEIPACFEAVEIGLLMSRQAADVVSMYALQHADVSEEDDPYWGPKYCDLNAMGSWLLVLTTANRDAMVDVFSCVGLEMP